MMSTRSNQAGFTLIEVLLALAIGSMVIWGFITVFWASAHAYEKGTAAADIQYMARRSIKDIQKDIKEAVTVNIKNEKTELVLNEKTGNELIYRTQNKNLLRVTPKNSLAIAENITKLHFDQYNNGLVEVRIEAESCGQEYVLSASVFPRTARP